MSTILDMSGNVGTQSLAVNMLFQPLEDSITLLERVLSGDFEAGENNLSVNSFISDNTIDNSAERTIIKSKDTSEDGAVCRFNRSTGEYAKGIPGGKLITCMAAKVNPKTGEANLESSIKYFEKQREKEGIKDE